MKHDVRCVVDCKDILGECGIWCPQDRVLWWIDVARPSLARLDPATGKVDNWALPKPVGSFALRRDGGFLLAFRSGLAMLDRPGGALQWHATPGARLDACRFNDGKCDRQGRFWVGTLDRNLKEPIGELYRIDPGFACITMDRGFTISNGLAWSPDQRTMYFTDTPARTIYAYDFDATAGQIANRRVFVRFDERPGRPDGCTVDAEGFLWTARVDGWCVDRYAPDGRLDHCVELPVQRPTCVSFGGEALDTLYVTTSTLGLAEEELARQPLAGGLFAVRAGVTGIAEPRFAA
jgi:L-arabinonolactonase